jgi:hypothetical protein
MGFDGPTPYVLSLTRGSLDAVRYVAHCAATEGGVAGSVKGAAIPYDLPLAVSGVSPRWTAGVWRSDAPEVIADQCLVDGETAYSTLDVTRDVTFYAGSFVRADNPSIVLNLEVWTKGRVVVEVHNPTDAAITTTVQTAAEVRGLHPLEQTVTVPPGASVRVQG